YHNNQTDLRPNCIQALMEAVSRCSPPIKLPPHLVKYLGKSHGAWHTAMEILQRDSFSSVRGDEKLRESTLDALSDLYETLSEDDMFYGLWKRRSKFAETNIGISYEQCGNWMQAQITYENAQTKIRSSGLPINETEYLLWEDHWIMCSQKLQQWDILTDFSKNENNIELMTECAFRLMDWTNDKDYLEQVIHTLLDAPSPRRKMFEAFMNLMKSLHTNSLEDFKKVSIEAHQLTLQKWHTLPNVVSYSHIPLLHSFQLLVEFEEATK
ncbi:7254_t:CDS:1, partial [Dentiscutata erythropus]